MRTTPLSMLIGGVGASVTGLLIKFRMLPFLQTETIQSGGRQVPTAEFAAFHGRNLLLFGAALLIASFIWWVIRLRGKRT